MREFDRLVKIIAQLRSPQGCPWDREQKVIDYERYLLEEAYELIEGIRSGLADSVKEELGDLFLILVMIAQLFKEKGKFDVTKVLNGICDKLIIRHPHVFAAKKLKNQEAVLAYWVRHKAKIKKRKTVFDRLPQAAPALLLAGLYFKELKHLGCLPAKNKPVNNLMISVAKALKKRRSNAARSDFLGQLLLAISQLAFESNLEPETILHAKTIKAAKQVHYK